MSINEVPKSVQARAQIAHVGLKFNYYQPPILILREKLLWGDKKGTEYKKNYHYKKV